MFKRSFWCLFGVHYWRAPERLRRSRRLCIHQFLHPTIPGTSTPTPLQLPPHLGWGGTDPAKRLQAVPDLGAGANLRGKPIFPSDNSWNQDISAALVDPNSTKLIASIGVNTTLHPDFGTAWEGAPNGIPYVVVSGKQKTVPIIFEYADESDPGPYPIPMDAPIEGGPNGTGDRHVIVIDRDNWKLYELFSAYPSKGGATWKAVGGAVFDLRSNALRRAGWTSADAAGLPVFAGLLVTTRFMSRRQSPTPFALRLNAHAEAASIQHAILPVTTPTRIFRRWECAFA